MNLIKYTNGLGHLLMSIICTLAGLVLVLIPGTDATTKGVGTTLILTVQSSWFISGSAKQVASEVVSQMNQVAGPQAETLTQVLTAVPKIVTVPKEDTHATTT